MRKRLISIFLVLFIVLANGFAYADVKKDETVYVKLNYNGTPVETKIVNHLYGFGSSSSYSDHGRYNYIKNMTGSGKPEVKDGGEIVWPMELLKQGDIYYEGEIEKKSPLSVNIKYYLDSKEIDPRELGGKNGHLRIDIAASWDKNVDWKKAQLMGQIQLTADLDVFKNISSEGTRVVVGKKANITFAAFPPSNQSFTIEMDGQNIYLESINISLVPMAFSLPEDMKKGFNELLDGVDTMEKGSKKLASGAGDLANGTGEFKNGMIKLDEGISRLHGGISEINKSSSAISGGMEQFHSGLKEMSKQGVQISYGFGQITRGMETLSSKGEEIYAGLGKLNGGVSDTSSGTAELSKGLDALSKGHSQLAQLAAMYLQSEDPMLRQLAQGIINEEQGLKSLNEGLKKTSGGLKQINSNMMELNKGFGEYKNGVNQMAGSMKQMEDGIKILPEAMGQMDSSFETMKNGINKYFSGVNEVNKGFGAIKENTSSLPQNADKLLKGQLGIRDGVLSLNSGIKTMNKEINSNLPDTLFGSGENSYRSFADNERNKNSTVQFVMRTPSIDRPEVEKDYKEIKEVKKGFFERLTDLFKFKS